MSRNIKIMRVVMGFQKEEKIGKKVQNKINEEKRKENTPNNERIKGC